MEVIIVSKEIVKPSTPTPPHLRNHKLCLIDQLSLDTRITPIFFYKKPFSQNHDYDLKNTLSQTLTIFYPLAGEFKKDSPFVDCNDNGVLYVETHVKNILLDDFLQNPNLPKLIDFLPQHASLSSSMNYGESHETLVSVQVTRFDCGGVVIGGVLPHKVLDFGGMSAFFNTWAELSRGDNRLDDKTTSLDFTSPLLLFPPQNHISEELSKASEKMFFKEGDLIVRRFTFDTKAIESIKMKATSESVPSPSGIEALTSFIWKHMILATRAIKGSSRPCMVTHLVNLRPRLDPKLPNAFGNILWFATSELLDVSDQNVELPHLMGIVRELIENMNSDQNLKSIEGDGALTYFGTMLRKIRPLLTNIDTYKFSSWCSLGLNDVDFGWGKPTWIAPVIDPLRSLNKEHIILVENASDGIEAWMVRNNEEMYALENDEEFLAYASLNPSVDHAP